MVFGAARLQGHSLGNAGCGKGLGVFNDLLRIGLIGRCIRFLEGDGLGSHDVTEGASEHHRAALVHVVGKLLLAQDDCTARAAQGLVGRRRHDVRPLDGVVVARPDLTGNEARKVCHVYHKYGSALVGNLAEAAEVYLARIGGKSRQQDEGLYLHRLLFDRIIVQKSSLLVHAVGMALEHAGGNVHPVAVGQVAAAGVVQSHQLLVAEPLAQHVELLVGQVGQGLHAQFLKRRGFHAGREDGPVGNEVRVRSRMGLHVGVVRTEELFRLAGCGVFHRVDVHAAAVVAVLGVAFRILVGQEVTHRRLHGQGAVVLARDELEVAALVVQLVHHVGGNLRRDGGDLLQVGDIGGHRGVQRAPRRLHIIFQWCGHKKLLI